MTSAEEKKRKAFNALARHEGWGLVIEKALGIEPCDCCESAAAVAKFFVLHVRNEGQTAVSQDPPIQNLADALDAIQVLALDADRRKAMAKAKPEFVRWNFKSEAFHEALAEIRKRMQ